ncbi:MAG: DUF333 domain-containing protein [Candidatus Woesearchaeota archaeon]
MKKIMMMLLILVFLLGCAKPQQNTQLANPASTYCIEHNGTLEIKDSPEGQSGICHLQNKDCE